MRPSLSSGKEHGLTLIEIFVILAVIAALAALLIPALIRAEARARRISCVSCLKQIGLATRVWEGDHHGKYPAQESVTNGGSMEYITGANAWRHFQVMSNELSTPYILICAAESDRIRTRATNFNFLSNSNLSYFVGIDANETNPELILSGDHNITNGTSLKNGVLDLTANKPAGWTAEMHNGVGDVGLSDGSVRQVSISDLQTIVTNTGLATNRLQMPILGP
jgi:competence protein ComGC